jgi:hypothetical protein
MPGRDRKARVIRLQFTMDAKIFGDTPVVWGRCLAVGLVLGMRAADQTIETIFENGPVAAGRTATGARNGSPISSVLIGLGDRPRRRLSDGSATRLVWSGPLQPEEVW